MSDGDMQTGVGGFGVHSRSALGRMRLEHMGMQRALTPSRSLEDAPDGMHARCGLNYCAVFPGASVHRP